MVAIAPIPLAANAQTGMLASPQSYVAPKITNQSIAPLTQVATKPWDPAVNVGTPGYAASTPQFDEARGTVAGRTLSLIDENSPLMLRAVSRANQKTSRRGYGADSSIGIGAAESAVLDYAVPIATSDAGAYNRNIEVGAGMLNEASYQEAAARARVAEQNTGNIQQANQANTVQDLAAQQFNVTGERDITLTEAELASKASIINAANEQQASEFKAQQANVMTTEQARLDSEQARFNTQQSNSFIMNQLDQANKVQLGDLNSFYENQLAANRASADLFQTTMNALDSIQKNVDMNASTKQQNINQQINMLKSGLAMMSSISGLDLGSALNFTVENPVVAPTGGITSAQLTQIQNKLDGGIPLSMVELGLAAINKLI